MSEPGGLERLRFIRSCSAPLSPETMSEIEGRFSVPVSHAVFRPAENLSLKK